MYADGDVETNRSGNISLNQIVAERFLRCMTMVGGLRASAVAFLGTGLPTACAMTPVSCAGCWCRTMKTSTYSICSSNGPGVAATGARPASKATKEIEAHGVSFIEVQDTTGNRTWFFAQNSALNRRVTPNTPMSLRSPARF